MEAMVIPSSDRDLLAQCVVDTFRSSGPGGQNVNTRDTAVRIRHSPSGIVVTCQRERSQLRNKQIALQELRDRLEALNRPKRKRIRTRVPRRVRAKIREQKKQRSLKKGFRKKPDLSD